MEGCLVPFCTKCGKTITDEVDQNFEEMCRECYGEVARKDFMIGCGVSLIDVPLTVGAIACLIGTVTCAIGLPSWVTEPWHRWFYSILFGVLSIVSIWLWIWIVKFGAKKMRLGEKRYVTEQQSEGNID